MLGEEKIRDICNDVIRKYTDKISDDSQIGQMFRVMCEKMTDIVSDILIEYDRQSHE